MRKAINGEEKKEEAIGGKDIPGFMQEEQEQATEQDALQEESNDTEEDDGKITYGNEDWKDDEFEE